MQAEAQDQDQDLLSLYQNIILDHGKSPRNTGRVERHDCSSDGKNPLCGDRVTVTAAVDESDIVTDLKFDAKGCAISIASASMMTEAAKGLTTDEVHRISDAVRVLCKEDSAVEDINESLGETLSARLESLRALSGVRQFPTRAKCALLPWQTLMACIDGNSTASTER
jgi:nitrogen fixation protein NifU and related proteins